MKRILSLFLALSFLLSLAACGKENPPASGGTGEPSSTLMTEATDLANEMDNMPLYGDVLTSISSSVKLESADLSKGENVFFYRDPEQEIDGVYFEEDSFPDDVDPAVKGNQYDRNHHSTENKGIDSIVDGWKEMKNLALLSCKELDVWVQRNPSTEIPYPSGITPSHTNYRYRIHYDVNCDLVTVEELVDGNHGFSSSYTCLTVGYTPDGKLKVDGYSTTFGETAINAVSSVHYLEDAYYMSMSDARESGESKITILNMETEQWVKIYPIFGYEDVGDMSVPKIVAIDYLLTFDRNGYLVELTKDTESVFLPDGRYGIEWKGLNDFYICLDFFDGWRQVESSDNNALLTLTTEKEEFFFHTLTHEDFDFLNREKFFFNLSYNAGTYPLLWLKRGNSLKQQGIDWTAADAEESMAELEKILGITAKKEAKDLIFSLREEHSTLENSFTFPFGGKTSCLLSVEEYEALTRELAYEGVTLDEILEAANSTVLAFDEQNPEYEYFEFLDFTVSGGASFDEATASLDLSKISATLSPSVLLNKDAAYRLVFLFVSNDGRSMVGSKEAVYTGEMLTVTGELRIPREGFPFSDEKYTLQCYLTDDRDNRISTIYTVKGAVSGEYDLSTESRGSTLIVSPQSITVENHSLPAEE